MRKLLIILPVLCWITGCASTATNEAPLASPPPQFESQDTGLIP